MISAARPKIADYPFTTLSPNLGVVALSDHRTFVVADLPGIIEGAHEGRGLGLQFLRHIERTRMLALLIPVDALDCQAEYDALRHEIGAYSPVLLTKPHCVVLTKMDLWGADPPPRLEAPDAFGVFAISAPRGKAWTTCCKHGGRSSSLCDTASGRQPSVSQCPEMTSDVAIWSQDATEYPPALRGLANAPDPLYAIGDRSVLDRQVVAIIGARRASSHSLTFARRLARTLARAGRVWSADSPLAWTLPHTKEPLRPEAAARAPFWEAASTTARQHPIGRCASESPHTGYSSPSGRLASIPTGGCSRTATG